ncbi:cytochrome C oxidase subunit IV family protein [uncultured Lutibacter sp.]|uniref:cytochrome C oxidase subunit IV family protein n=1 Tax=uncultured Lutibacter sp. TaxID=437739 RepID=UPI00262BA951|nr:cytochrome C oxidase subunit IV family protein [uncultured Lutibacter sp.]
MKNAVFLKVLIVLIVLTIVSAIFSNSNLEFTSTIILILSIFKFVGVSFYFMELRKAHVFWKASVLIFLFLFSVVSLNILW